MNIIGKTVAAVTEQEMVADDTYKDEVYVTQTVITFTDGTEVTFGDVQMDLYDLRPVEG